MPPRRGLGNETRFFLVLFILAGIIFVSVVRPATTRPPPSEDDKLTMNESWNKRNTTTWIAPQCDFFAWRHAATKTMPLRKKSSGFTSIDTHRREASLDFWQKKPRLPRECPINFTLATQSTPERLWMLKFICRRWTGPIVIAVYTDQHSVQKEPECPNVDYVIVSTETSTFQEHTSYPVNKLRNLAIARVKTSHFVMADIDLWPDSSLLRRLDVVAKNDPNFFRDPLRAVVIAAFAREVKTDCSSSTAARDTGANYRMRECYREAELMPTTFTQLKDCIIQKECHVFDRYNQDGHGTTDYRAWLRQEVAKVRHVPCFLSNRYEPYVVLARSPILPPFEEQFTGYGKNKIQNLVHLRYVGWKFSVFPRSFLIHFPHHKSAARMAWERKHPGGETALQSGDQQLHRTTMDHLYRRFLDSLIAVYGSPGTRRDTTVLCNTPRGLTPPSTTVNSPPGFRRRVSTSPISQQQPAQQQIRTPRPLHLAGALAQQQHRG